MGLRWPAIDCPSLRHPQRATGALETMQEPLRPNYTLCLPVSRPWAWERWLMHFRHVALPPGTECLAIVDHGSEEFFEEVKAGLATLQWSGLRVLWMRRPAAAEWGDLEQRRARICGHWHTFLAHAQGRVVLGAEDDTLPDWDAYILLLEHLGAGTVFAQGTCIGRWDAGIVPHWTVVQDGRGPCEWRTGTYEGQDVVPIQGGGWFCFAALTEALRGVEFGASPEPVGPDVWTCYQLARQGRCVGDWGVQALHIAETMDLSPNRETVDLVTFRREAGRWRRTITAGRGRVIEGREVQLAGSQPRPVESMRLVKTIRMYGNAPTETVTA